jgi:hypothetical protein
MNLYTAGIIDTTTGFSDSSYRLTNYSVPGLQLALVMVLGVWSSSAYSLGVEVFNLDLGLLLSNPTTCFTTFISSLLDCRHFNSIFGLVLLSGMLTSLQLVQGVENAELTEVSGWLIARMILMTLCAAGTPDDIVSGIGVFSHSLYSCSFPGLLLVLISALGVWTLACLRVIRLTWVHYISYCKYRPH